MRGTMAFRVGRILYAGESGHQDKRRPIIRMGITLPDLDHSLSQCQSAVRVIEQAAVERFHEVRRAAVVYVPQRQKQALCPGRKQAAYKTDEFVPGGDDVQAGRTAAQRLGREAGSVISVTVGFETACGGK